MNTINKKDTESSRERSELCKIQNFETEPGKPCELGALAYAQRRNTAQGQELGTSYAGFLKQIFGVQSFQKKVEML